MAKAQTIVDVNNVNWSSLQDILRDCNSEADAKTMLKKEMRGKRRVQHMLRIHGRLNKLRQEREREEILSGTFK